jgi:hypothetical protein
VRVASILSAMHVFQKTGIFPVEPGVLTEWTFDQKRRPKDFNKIHRIFGKT